MTATDYAAGPALTGTLPDGTEYDIPTFRPDPAKVAAGGNGFLLTNVPGYYTDYQGVELGLVKRLSNRWMARAGFSYNNAREHFSSSDGLYDANGNPTRTLTEPLVDGGQFAPESGGSGSGTIFVNAKWQLNVNGLYQAPHGIEISANVFGRQGYPYPLFPDRCRSAPTRIFRRWSHRRLTLEIPRLVGHRRPRGEGAEGQ